MAYTKIAPHNWVPPASQPYTGAKSPNESTDKSRPETETEDDGDTHTDTDQSHDTDQYLCACGPTSCSPNSDPLNNPAPEMYGRSNRRCFGAGPLEMNADAHIAINHGQGGGVDGEGAGADGGMVSLMPNDDFAKGVAFRRGINRADTKALIRCPFEETVEILMEVEAVGEKDGCRGITENVMFGQLAPVETGAFDAALGIDMPSSITTSRFYGALQDAPHAGSAVSQPKQMGSTLRTKLDALELYPSHLPDSLRLPGPIQATYPFDLFEISPEDLEDYGEGAVNRELEIAFGSRHNGPIVLFERGPVRVQAVDILQTYLQKDPNSAVLQKWVDGPATSAKLCFSHDNIPKLDSKKISDANDLAYEDIPELEGPRKGGAKLLPLLLQVSVHCHAKDKPSEGRARCIGSRLCHTSWKWPRARQRILDRASKCGYIVAKLRDAAVVELARKAAGPAAVILDERADGGQPSSQKKDGGEFPGIRQEGDAGEWRLCRDEVFRRASDEVDEDSLALPSMRSAPRPRRKQAENLDDGSNSPASDTFDGGNTWLDAPRQLEPETAKAERAVFTLGGRSGIDVASPFL
ncbi:hypothetical protein L210DRAFT_3652904 [Boletus edulis BED1]|uniref:Uncharacterized protein n=1 Tax=Boletus edulis BED1 TaxID=1328754 RepID=A0AAD4BF55_BOLED|nr:hypothetical protein L210DRAFT_3652904 [Boletus edulis BED1]